MIGWLKPGQVPVVLTRQVGYPVPGGRVVSSVGEAMDLAGEQGVEELLVCGGGQVYEAALPRADEVILTKVDTDVEGDTWFPGMAAEDWKVVEQRAFPADAENVWPLTICRMVRRL